MTWFLKRRTTLSTEHRLDRDAFRDELDAVKERLNRVELEVEQWRARYYAEREYAHRLRIQLLDLGTEPEERKRWTQEDTADGA